MKKLLLILIALPLLFSSCNNNYNKAEMLYKEGVKENSGEKLFQAILKLNMIQSYQDDFNRGKVLRIKLDSVIEKINNAKEKQIIESDTIEVYKVLHNINDDEMNVLLNKIENEKKEVEKKHQLDKKEKLKSLNKLKKNFDDVSGITWYKQPYFTHYNNRFLTSIYMGEESSSKWLRLKMSYSGNDWIFFDNAILSYDGNSKTISFDKYKDKETDNSGGNVWEWIDVSVDKGLENFLREFAKSKNAKMRFSGKYTKTRTLTYNERRGIIDVLNGYDALNE